MKLVWTFWASQHPQLPSFLSMFLLPIRALWTLPVWLPNTLQCSDFSKITKSFSFLLTLVTSASLSSWTFGAFDNLLSPSFCHICPTVLASLVLYSPSFSPISLVTSGRLLIHPCPSKSWCASRFCVWTPSLHIYSSSTPRWSDGRTCRRVKLSPLTHHNKRKGGTILWRYVATVF